MDIDVRKDVLPWIQGDATNALLIVEHPHNEQILCDSQGFHYYDPKTQKTPRRLRGLTGPLTEAFWPDQLLPAVKSRHRRPLTANAHPTAQLAARGMLRGNIIHEQIQALVSLDAERFHRKYTTGAHPWSYGALDALLDQGIRPLASELSVAALDIGVATKIDMVGVKRDGTLVVIEWKTGYEDEAWTSASRWMRGPLRGVLTDSAKNRAIVQAVVGAKILHQSRKLHGRIECMVVHISSRGTEFIPVTPEFLRRGGPALYRALATHQAARSSSHRAAKMKKKKNKKPPTRRQRYSIRN